MEKLEPQCVVFVVDDDEFLLKCLVRQVQRRGEVVGGFTSGVEMLPRLSESPALVVSDYHLPGMDGLDIARAVRAASPSTRILLLTGTIETEPLAVALQEGLIDRFLWKPWNMATLAAAMDELLVDWRLRR